MIKEAIGLGLTIDEAKEDAIAKLGASEFEDIQFDVVTMPKKKVLGIFGGSKAEVRAYVEVAEKKQKQNNKKTAKPKPAKAEKPAPKKAEKEVIEPVKTETEANPYSEPVDQSEVPADSPAGKAIAYIKNVLKAIGCEEVSIKVAHRENGSKILLDGEDLSIIIGRRGETLDSLQYLASLAANNGGGHYRISINIGNYREKREETLINLANKIAAQVLKTGKSRTLEPMNPYERRIIHTAIQSIEGVVSNSYGEGTGRRIIISKEGAEVKPPRYNDRRRGGSRPAKRSQSNTVAAPVREPKKDSDTPLYGKIN